LIFDEVMDKIVYFQPISCLITEMQNSDIVTMECQ